MKKTMILLLALMLVASPVFAGLTVDNCVSYNYGSRRAKTCEVQFDSSYLTGGELLDYTAYGFIHVDLVRAVNAGGYVFEYNYTTKQLRAFTAGSEASVGSDLTGLSDIKVEIIGY